jgi:hypothetical protein
MGMDVYGKKPTDPKGEYFRANVWYWRPLWIYVDTINPDLTSKVEYPHSNDGSGLNAKDSRLLAQLLQKEIESGNTEKYIKDYMEYLDSIPLEDCEYCEKTGYRTWNENGLDVQKVCNACSGKLQVKSFQTYYPMHIDVVKEFQQFLHYCGGFQIF